MNENSKPLFASIYTFLGIRLGVTDILMWLVYLFVFFMACFAGDATSAWVCFCFMFWIAIYLKTREETRRGTEAIIMLTNILEELQDAGKLSHEQYEAVGEALRVSVDGK